MKNGILTVEIVKVPIVKAAMLMTAQVMVTAALKAGLEMDMLIVKIKHGVVILPALIMTVETALVEMIKSQAIIQKYSV